MIQNVVGVQHIRRTIAAAEFVAAQTSGDLLMPAMFHLLLDATPGAEGYQRNNISFCHKDQVWASREAVSPYQIDISESGLYLQKSYA
jgi:hypothetical protein